MSLLSMTVLLAQQTHQANNWSSSRPHQIQIVSALNSVMLMCPSFVWEYALFDDMYLARTRNLDNNERDLRFLSVGEGGLPSHPLASGISGTPGQDIRVTTSNDAFSWGVILVMAQIISPSPHVKVIMIQMS